MWRQQHINLLESSSSFWRLQDSSLMFLSALNFLGLDSSTATRLQGITPWYWWRPYFWVCRPKTQLHQATLYSDVASPLALVNLKRPTPFLTSQYSVCCPPKFRRLFYLTPHWVEPGGSSSNLNDHELTPILIPSPPTHSIPRKPIFCVIQLHLEFWSGLFHSEVPTKFLHAIFISQCVLRTLTISFSIICSGNTR
jgi:hypothetical protein